MHCLKCGKEIAEKEVFCKECLAVMAKFPVKPETKIFLPLNTAPTVIKKNPQRRRPSSLEERILRLKKVILWLSVFLLIAVLSLVLSVALLVDSLSGEKSETAIGQNYGTMTESSTEN